LPSLRDEPAGGAVTNIAAWTIFLAEIEATAAIVP